MLLAARHDTVPGAGFGGLPGGLASVQPPRTTVSAISQSLIP